MACPTLSAAPRLRDHRCCTSYVYVVCFSGRSTSVPASLYSTPFICVFVHYAAAIANLEHAQNTPSNSGTAYQQQQKTHERDVFTLSTQSHIKSNTHTQSYAQRDMCVCLCVRVHLSVVWQCARFCVCVWTPHTYLRCTLCCICSMYLYLYIYDIRTRSFCTNTYDYYTLLT